MVETWVGSIELASPVNAPPSRPWTTRKVFVCGEGQTRNATEGYVPPLDVSIVDALNHLVICMEMNSHGVFRNIADLHTALRPTLPMVITVTDSTGRTWKSPLTPPA